MNLTKLTVLLAIATLQTSCGIFAPAVVTRTTPTETTLPEIDIKEPTLTNDPVPPPPITPPKTNTAPKKNTPNIRNIALVLPLKMTDSGSSNHTQRGLDSVLQFYQGFSLAMDSLSKAGLSGYVNVIDNPNANIDFLKNNYDFIAQFQADDAAKVYLPNIKTNAQDTANYKQYNINTSMPQHIDALLEHINQNYYGCKITVIHRTQKLEVQVADNFMEQSNALKLSTPPTQITNDKPKLIDIQPSLIKGKNNIIYLCSFDEAYIMSLMRELKTLAEPYNITIVGLPSWRNFKTIELEQFEKYHVIVSSANITDYAEPPAAAYQFRKQYFTKYGTEPRIQAYKGYDTGLYFGSLMLKYPENPAEYTTKPVAMLHNIYNFENTPTPNVYQNKGVNILQYKNYRFEKQ